MSEDFFKWATDGEHGWGRPIGTFLALASIATGLALIFNLFSISESLTPLEQEDARARQHELGFLLFVPGAGCVIVFIWHEPQVEPVRQEPEVEGSTTEAKK